jgi:hypothetical protein
MKLGHVSSTLTTPGTVEGADDSDDEISLGVCFGFEHFDIRNV